MRIHRLATGGYFFLALVIFQTALHGQSSNIGIPPISNFYKQDYNARPQNWDIAQASNGMMYFANNEGLLEFDGVNWRVYKVNNQTKVRSVEITTDGKIFVGAQGELGYFQTNEAGALVYNSLVDLLKKEDQNFGDVWDIEFLEGQIYFRTGDAVFLYENEALKKIYRGKSLTDLSKVNNDIFIDETNDGLLKLEDGVFKIFSDQRFFAGKEVRSIFSFGIDTILITTMKNGCFLSTNGQVQAWKINDGDALKKSSIHYATRINETHFAFATASKGIFIVNKKGQVIRQLNRKVGLQANNVICLFVDHRQNVWAGLENGIDYIETSSPFAYLFPDGDLKGMGYAVQVHEDKIYFGTANGVYVNDWLSYYNPTIESSFEKVKGADGQVWDLAIHQDELFLNHHSGTFVIENEIAKQVSSKIGSWLQLPVAKDKLLSGNYDGLSILERQDGWGMGEDFQRYWSESCRIMVQDQAKNIWVSHPYRGVFKISFNEDFTALEKVEEYTDEHGFPSKLQIYVFKVGEEVVFCAERGVYSYDAANNRFELNEKWTHFFGKDTRIKRLIEAPNRDIWFVTNEEVGVLETEDRGVYKHLKKRVFPELKDKLVDDFEEILPYNDENVFIAFESGFVHFNPQKTPIDTSFQALIRSVHSVQNDSMLYWGNPVVHQNKIPVIEHEKNELLFTFSATYFGSAKNNEFQHFLEGFDEKWSSWSNNPQVEYTNLDAGSYTFQVRAKNVNGVLSNVATYPFKIAPPWYATKLAFLIYTLCIGALLFSMIFIPKKRFEREKAALEFEQEKTLLQKEQELQLIEKDRQKQISRLEKEKLELQIESQNQELASSTMHLVQKSEMIQKIKDDIQKIAAAVEDKKIASDLKKVIQKVSADERLDDDWENFAKHFDQVHDQFLTRLRSSYPNLTPNDHRLCAYLRMNLSSKEISPLMNISVRSVEVARYRLRKKLEIDGAVNLVDFMMEV